MRHLLPLFLSLLALFAQAQPEVLSTATQTARYRINLAAGELSPISGGSASGRIESLQASIRYGELQLNYSLAPTDDEEQYYLTKLTASLNGQPLLLAPEQIKGDIGRLGNGGAKQATLTGLLDRFINLEGELSITLTAEQWGEFVLPLGINCDEPPTFNGKQRLPYLIAAGVGAASIGVGQLIKQQSDDTYNNEYLTAGSLSEAQPIYEDANNKHHTYLILTYAGSAILAVDAVLYIIRGARHQRRLKLFRQYCEDGRSLGFEPLFELPSGLQPSGRAGFKMTLNF
ncbi:MAG: hypothetical protein KDD06_16490 [Phaeodactylibacter sp.]|nr:hypothetical protein [Phaeodactylibacter sp.]